MSRSSWLAVGLVTALSAGAALADDAGEPRLEKKQAETTGWVRTSKDDLAGKIEIVEYASDALPKGYFDEVVGTKNPKYALVYTNHGGMETFVFETLTSVTRSYDFPGDEVINVRNGTMVMIDEPSGRKQEFKTGTYYIVPKHWRGTWEFKSDPGAKLGAREYSQASGGQWSNTQPGLDRAKLASMPNPPGVIAVDLKDAEAKVKAFNFDHPAAAPAGKSALLGHVIFTGEPSFLMLKSTEGGKFTRTGKGCDAMVRVLKGTVELSDGKKSETFVADDALVIPAGFKGSMKLSAGFTGVSVIAGGTENAQVPAKPVAATQRCTAF